MNIQISRVGDDIFCNKNYTNIKDKGEISHILMELEFIKQDLMELWEEFCEDER